MTIKEPFGMMTTMNLLFGNSLYKYNKSIMIGYLYLVRGLADKYEPKKIKY